MTVEECPNCGRFLGRSSFYDGYFYSWWCDIHGFNGGGFKLIPFNFEEINNAQD